ncbi:MAG: phytoene/squalene synthase family protein [Hyphomicrobiaceae bacterium]
MPQLWSEAEPTTISDMAACRALLRHGSKTFFAASYLLPKRVREPASALYAFCRLADDAVDLGGDPVIVIADLRRRLDLAYTGRPAACPADRAFAATVYKYGVPRQIPEALIEGFEWDFESRRYETLSELEAYAARVAGTVGTMMAIVMGVRSAAALARACDLGIAMQLTNIARDVGEDARSGRLYLPRSWMREAGLDPDAWLAAPRFDERLALVVERLLDQADRLYTRSQHGIAMLPGDCRAGIRAAGLLYSDIGREVRKANYDSVSRRAVVATPRKLVLLARAYATPTRADSSSEWSAIEAARFLIEPAAGTHVPGHVGFSDVPWWNLHARWVRVIEIFERLERHERMLASQGPLRTSDDGDYAALSAGGGARA